MDQLVERFKVENQANLGLKAELQEAHAQNATLQGLLEQKNHAAMLAGPRSLAQRQADSRDRNLIRRGAALRAVTSDPELRRLIDTVDLLLTQLALADPANPADVSEYDRMVKQADLPRRIGETIGGQRGSEPLQLWLVEAERVLSGRDHAL